MNFIVRRAAAVTSAALLTTAGLALSAQPAAAQTKTFDDGGGYVSKVVVKHTSKYVDVDAKVGKVTLGGEFVFYLDTKKSDKGPEFKVEVYPNSDGIALLKVNTFASQGSVVNCDVRAKADAYGNDHVTIRVPRSCLKNPAKVRVALRATYAVPGPDVVDWAPAKKKFFGSVLSN